MKRLSSLLAILMMAAATGCNNPSNLLIGKWTLDTTVTSSPYCLKSFQFDEKTYTSPDPQGKMNTIPVTYVAGETKTFPTVVYVMTDAGISAHVDYRFLSKDKMILDTALQCPYVRA